MNPPFPQSQPLKDAFTAAYAPASEAESLSRQFGLTPQQARVAQLLAQRLTNREIAQSLAISEHTARRHTECVLEKLGVGSRLLVRSRLQMAG